MSDISAMNLKVAEALSTVERFVARDTEKSNIVNA